VRGLAVLSAGAAAWVIVTGRVPSMRTRAISTPPITIIAGGMAVWAAVALLAFGLTGVPAAAVALGAIGAAVPASVAVLHKSRAREATAEAWPDFLAMVRSSLASGASLPEAFVAAGSEMSGALRGAADRVAESVRNGASFETALAELREQLADPTADRILTSLAAAHRTGGARVGNVLGALGDSVADELRLRKAHRAALTQQRLTAAVALVAPWALLVLTLATNPQAAAVYRTSSGARLILIGLLATGGGFLAAHRAARLSRPPRVLQ
jgi:tight adherence protein B